MNTRLIYEHLLTLTVLSSEYLVQFVILFVHNVLLSRQQVTWFLKRIGAVFPGSSIQRWEDESDELPDGSGDDRHGRPCTAHCVDVHPERETQIKCSKQSIALCCTSKNGRRRRCSGKPTSGRTMSSPTMELCTGETEGTCCLVGFKTHPTI